MPEKSKHKNSALYGYREGWISIIANTALFVLKYWAGITTGSVAIIADAWHTLSDSLTSIIVIAGFRISEAPPDREHPFGHGRAELIGSIIIGVILGVVAFNFTLESLQKLRDHEPVIYGTLAIVATAVSIVVKELLAQYAMYAGKKTGSRSLIADAWHHRSDAISSVIILAGILVSSRYWWVDGVLGLAVSMVLFHATFSILKKSADILIGEEPDSGLLQRLEYLAESIYGSSLHLHHVHIHRYGEHVELTFHIRFPGNMNIRDAHEISTSIENAVLEELGMNATIHYEPLKEDTE